MSLPAELSEALKDIEELETAMRERLCRQLREAIERLKARPHWPLLKPFIRSILRGYLEECGVEL